MKQRILQQICLLGIMLALLWSCRKDETAIESELFGLSAAELYYWSGGTKVPLKIEQNRLIIRSTLDEQNAGIQLTATLGHTVSVSTLQTGYLVIQTETNLPGSAIQKIKDMETTLEVAPSFTIGGSYAIPTGEIVLKPKMDNTIQSILERYADNVSLVNSTTYGSFTLKVNKLADLLPIANGIYESGAVEWCHPDFVSKIVLSF